MQALLTSPQSSSNYPVVPRMAEGGMAEAARQVQARGRGDDTMLIHMTPAEVGGLQALAKASGGSLTVNPDTGLPEAGWLGKLLPTILGVAGAAFGIPTWAIGLGVGAGQTALTGDLNKGLMAGLGAFGGASLAGGLGVGANAANAAATGATAAGAGGAGAGALGTEIGTSALTNTLAGGANVLSGATPALSGGANALASGISAAGNAAPGFLDKFAAASRAGLPQGMLSKAAPYAAGLGVLNTASELSAPKLQRYEEPEDQYPYAGPYTTPPRPATYPTAPGGFSPNVTGPGLYGTIGQRNSGEHLYFQNTNPVPGFVPIDRGLGALQTQPAKKKKRGYKEGGEVPLEDGAFIVDARTVSELGNGSSGAGQELLAKMGGEPLQGPGDGVSDSIRAKIGGTQEARVARDEVKFSPQAVARVGGGDHKKGTQKLYALMDRAHKARKKAARGEDTGLRKGLA